MMYGHYRQVSSQELEDIRNSRTIQKILVYSDSSEPPYGDYFCIGIYWQVINFLLTRLECLEPHESYLLKNIVFGGEPLDKDEDIWFDFGPIRFLSPDQVQKISEYINKISSESLTACYNHALLAEHQIYPDNWWMQDQKDVIDQIKDYYSKLVSFFKKAAVSEKYILTYITA